MERKASHSYYDGFEVEELEMWNNFLPGSTSTDDQRLGTSLNHYQRENSASVLCPPTPPLLRDSYPLGKEFSSLINSGDIENLKRFFMDYCTLNCLITHNVEYSPESMSLGTFYNPLGNFQSLTFPNLPFFFQFIENFYRVFPDAVMKIEPNNYNNEDNITTNILSDVGGMRFHSVDFQWTGTSVVYNSSLIQIDPNYRTLFLLNKSQDFSYVVSNPFPSRMNQNFPRMKMNGNIRFCINSQSKQIERIDFTYHFLSN
mmetsp:Transcript_713/g.739  ORF Transcript_713/g.739 Transcript_713/m.739 type:complete len:258 (-) Transcript_713:740-1513(-)